MIELSITPEFEGWQQVARTALRQGVPPQEIIWQEQSDSEQSLSLFEPWTAPASETPNSNGGPKVPRRFLEAARTVSLHSDKAKWALLYRVLFRLTHGHPKLLENPSDPDLIALNHLEKEVSKDAYRMIAFVRFREVATDDGPWFVAWYEPEHDTLSVTADFFRERFANMRWSILTPRKCMHWDGEKISFSEGVSKASAPTGDFVEPLWLTYYGRIFNPARVKVKAMQAQLPKRNWKNLPEAAVIEPALREAPQRVSRMLAESEFHRSDREDFSTAPVPVRGDLGVLREAAAGCRACPLWKAASCTVFGEGAANAEIVFVGEQPGDQEDRLGKPFVGPAGKVLDQALAAAGIDRASTYVTNAVKHFKFEPRGKRRIHKTASSREIAACRPWLEAELNWIKPKLVVALGVTATHSLFGSPIRIGSERGKILPSAFGPVLVTVHPSSLLRLPEGSNYESEFQHFVRDLREVASYSPPRNV